jgi:hypothetical protein
VHLLGVEIVVVVAGAGSHHWHIFEIPLEWNYSWEM